MNMPRPRKPWSRIIVELLMGIVFGGLLVFAACDIKAAFAQDCDELNEHQFRLEMLERGYSRFGCWTEHKVLARWTPPTEGGPVSRYELHVTGTGTLMRIDRIYRYVFAESLETWWPAGCDTLVAEVRGVGPGGTGPWSALSDTFIIAN